MITISVANYKGGVGKTTSVASIGSAMNHLTKKVLLIDLDPQSNLSTSFGIKEANPNIYKVIMGESSIESAIIPVSLGLGILPSHIDLCGADVELASEAGRELILKDLLSPIRKEYDYCLIDLPPSFSIPVLNALTCSDSVLIPMQGEFLATQGLGQLTKVINKIKSRLNPNLEIGGIFLNRFDKRKLLSRDVLSVLEKKFGNKMFNTKIRDNIAAAEAPSSGKSILEYAPNCGASEDFKALAKEIMERFNG